MTRERGINPEASLGSLVDGLELAYNDTTFC